MARGFRAAGRLRVAAWLLILAPVHLGAQSMSPASHEVEAAYLYQFGRYVEWPANRRWASDTFDICVLGMDPFGTALDSMVEGRAIGGRPVVARRILDPNEAQDCRIVFVSASEDAAVPAILLALEPTDAVTVGRGAPFTRAGGMIAFVAQEQKVRFVVNLAAAEAAGLRLSSQLLRVAVRVER
jgi:hypothetical protein